MTAELSVGCFGKLPIFSDFIRQNASGREITALDDWFQQGILLAKSKKSADWDSGFTKAPSFRFMFRPSGGKVVAGKWIPGKDQLGRQYPFVVFTVVDGSPFETESYLLPALLQPFFEGVEKILNPLPHKVEELLHSVARLRSLRLPPSEESRQSYRHHLHSTSASNLWSSMAGGDPWLLIQNLVDILWKTPIQAPRIGLKFPLAPNCFGVTFWLDAILRAVRSHGIPPLSFWSSDALFVFLQPALPHAFLHMVWPASDSDHVCPLDQEGTPDPVRVKQRLGPRRSEILGDSNRTLADILEALQPN